MSYEIRRVENEEELGEVLRLCYSVLGNHLKDVDNYRYEDWVKRLDDGGGKLLLYAGENGRAVSAVLGRRESNDSLILGFVACDEKYRGQGITKRLMLMLEENAREIGYKYITLGADDMAVGFYEKCGYTMIGSSSHGQKIYQKLL